MANAVYIIVSFVIFHSCRKHFYSDITLFSCIWCYITFSVYRHRLRPFSVAQKKKKKEEKNTENQRQASESLLLVNQLHAVGR